MGEAVWIKTPKGTSSTIVLSGEVPEGDSKEISVRKGFSLIANPFPSTISIQSVQPDENFPGLDAENSYAPQSELQIWTGTGYQTFGWDPDGDPDVAGSDHKWVDEDLAVADVDILIGKGFWIKTPVAGKVTISK